MRVEPQGSGRIPATLAVRSYPVVDRHTMLWIWMGADEADPDLIPDFSYIDPGAPGAMPRSCTAACLVTRRSCST
ncbi:MAG: hypothetical protein ABI706_10715 [Ilumatobacteraceae bacterium]